MKSARGFSLLEVMVAIAILAMSFIALINFQGQTMFRVKRAENLTTATLLAQQKMGELMLQFEKEMEQQSVFPDDRNDHGNFEEPFSRFAWEWNVRKVDIPTPEAKEGGIAMMMLQTVAANIKDRVRELRLTIKWDEMGKEKKFDVVTHITKIQ